MKGIISLFITLIVIWLLLSGHTDPLLLSLGLASVILTVIIDHRMDVVDHEGNRVRYTTRLITYIPWLAWETIKANITVAKLIINPKMPIHPNLFTVKASQPGELGKTIYANSITLTPGTVSMSVDGDEILVHAIDQGTADDLLTGEMDRRVTRVAGEH
jgi:multicomponent Na+:H+ antiporter subunit E